MGKHLTRVKVGVVGAPGTGTISLGDPIRSDIDGDCLTIAEAGGVDGEVYSYVVIDGGNFAEGEAAWSSSGNALGRDALEKRWNGTDFVTGKLNLSADAIVMLTPRAPDLITDWSEITSKPSTFPPAAHDASLITSGTLDVARIPVLPSSLQIVSSGGIADLTSPQQADIGKGTIVTATDGRRFVYTGTGSKTSEASYIVLADITPEWSAIANKPTMTTAGLALLDDADAAAQRATLGISAANTPFTPVGSIAATTVQAALEEVAAEAVSLPVKVQYGTVTSGDTQILIQNLTNDFSEYVLDIYSLVVNNTLNGINLRGSTNNGTSWGLSWDWHRMQPSTSSSAVNSNNTSLGWIALCTAAADTEISGSLTLVNPMNASLRTLVRYMGTTSGPASAIANGRSTTTAAVNAIRIEGEAFVSGSWALWGTKK